MKSTINQVEEPMKLVLENPIAEEQWSHKGCVMSAYDYLSKRCNIVLPEFFTHNAELPDVLGFKNEYSTVIEVKISRSDFFADRKKLFRIKPEKGMGDYRYYCCPKGLIKKEEVPEGWGLLYVYPGGKIREVKQSYFHRPITPEQWNYGGRFDKNTDAEMHVLYYYARRAGYAGVHKTVLEYRGYDV